MVAASARGWPTRRSSGGQRSGWVLLLVSVLDYTPQSDPRRAARAARLGAAAIPDRRPATADARHHHLRAHPRHARQLTRRATMP